MYKIYKMIEEKVEIYLYVINLRERLIFILYILSDVHLLDPKYMHTHTHTHTHTLKFFTGGKKDIINN